MYSNLEWSLVDQQKGQIDALFDLLTIKLHVNWPKKYVTQTLSKIDFFKRAMPLKVMPCHWSIRRSKVFKKRLHIPVSQGVLEVAGEISKSIF